MLQLKPLDSSTPIFQQLGADVSPAVLVDIFQVGAAFNHPDFRAALAQYPSSAVASPHLFTRLIVPNLCVGP